MNKNVYKQDTGVSRLQREQLKGHPGMVLWFTGLSGSGKSTIAAELHKLLTGQGLHSYMLDGDNIRLGINADLDFSELGRRENIRRIAEIGKLFTDAGIITLSAFVSPFKQDREQAKNIIGTADFIEIFVDCPLEICEQRDVKGLYARARKGEIKDFTGIDSPYEAPERPNLVINSGTEDLKHNVIQIWDYLKKCIADKV